MKLPFKFPFSIAFNSYVSTRGQHHPEAKLLRINQLHMRQLFVLEAIAVLPAVADETLHGRIPDGGVPANDASPWHNADLKITMTFYSQP